MEHVHQMLPRAVLERAPVPELTTINGVVMSVVFITARPTFTGVIGGYTTLTQDDDTTATQASVIHSSVATASQSRQTSFSKLASTAQVSNAASTLVPSTAVNTVASATVGFGSSTNTAVFGSASTSSSSSSSQSTSGEWSVGAKIGLAIGIIFGIGIVLGLILLLLGRKRKQMKKQAQSDSEKKAAITHYPVTGAAAPTPDAPRLSLRPVSRLVPEFMGGQQRNRTSQGNMLAPINENNVNRSRNVSPAHELTERPRTGDNPFRDPENPFADPEKGLRGHAPVTQTSPVSPIMPPALLPPAVTAPEHRRQEPVAMPTAEAFPTPQHQTHPQALTPGASNGPTTKSIPMPAPLVIPPVTTHYELPAAPSPVIAPGPGPGPESPPQGNVYRILMEFKPTMDDELELRAGQLVRMLHEYDDGWALCIRLDRSQQGVVPRTCLAAKPSKPRPGPPPHAGPGSRPMTPQGRPRGPPGPPGPGMAQSPVRAQSPSTFASNLSADTGAFNQPPRPLSPGPRPQPQPQKRSMSPSPYVPSNIQPVIPIQQRRRSSSASAASVRNKQASPPGPSKLGPGTPPVRSESPGLAL